MSRRSSFIKMATKAGILFVALFLVTVLIAAIPAHQQKALEVVIAPEQQPSQDSAMQERPSSGERGTVRNVTSDRPEAHHHPRHTTTTMRDRSIDEVAQTHKH